MTSDTKKDKEGELKAIDCPFCDNVREARPSVHITESRGPGKLYNGRVECSSCTAKGPWSGLHTTRELVIIVATEKWNRRPHPDTFRHPADKGDKG